MHSNTIASHNLDTKPISNPSTRNLFNRVGSHVIHHLENCSTAAISADCALLTYIQPLISSRLAANAKTRASVYVGSTTTSTPDQTRISESGEPQHGSAQLRSVYRSNGFGQRLT